MTRLAVGVAVTLAVLSGSGCGESRARREARGELVDQLVDGGLTEQVAECVIDAFFDARNDDELREFFERERLLDNERAEFARLGGDLSARLSQPSAGTAGASGAAGAASAAGAGAGSFFFGGGTPTLGAPSANSGQRRRLTIDRVRSSFIATSSS